MRWPLVLLLVGCAGARSGPNATLDAYARALADRDWPRAYDLMSDEFKKTTTREEYIAVMRENPEEVRLTRDRLSDRRGQAEQTAEFGYGVGDSMRLVMEDGAWRVATSPLAYYDQSTPRAALRSFVRAYRLQRWDVMLRFVPNKYRSKMDVDIVKRQFADPDDGQMAAMMSTLEGALDGEIVERGNEARMAYGEASEVQFIREDGIWKIKDPD